VTLSQLFSPSLVAIRRFLVPVRSRSLNLAQSQRHVCCDKLRLIVHNGLLQLLCKKRSVLRLYSTDGYSRPLERLSWHQTRTSTYIHMLEEEHFWFSGSTAHTILSKHHYYTFHFIKCPNHCDLLKKQSFRRCCVAKHCFTYWLHEGHPFRPHQNTYCPKL